MSRPPAITILHQLQRIRRAMARGELPELTRETLGLTPGEWKHRLELLAANNRDFSALWDRFVSASDANIGALSRIARKATDAELKVRCVVARQRIADGVLRAAIDVGFLKVAQDERMDREAHLAALVRKYLAMAVDRDPLSAPEPILIESGNGHDPTDGNGDGGAAS